MHLCNRVVRCIVTVLFATLTLQTVGFGQAPVQADQGINDQKIIEAAEESYRQGQEAFRKGQLEVARKLFDHAIDSILTSGIDLRTNSRFQAYFDDLVDRIHKHYTRPVEDRVEIVEPALLDQFAQISEAELATKPGDTKIFGKYDFDFSIAPPVLQFMDFFMSGRGRSTMEAGLQRSGRYREMAERIFKEERVPLDLIWLAQAESVWKPNALSRASAKGIWQFIPSTGLRYGLQQTFWVDERSQPEKSTRAAARYLRWLYDHFAGDWLLAMAAYNSGEGRVDDAIARCGYADFWELHRRGLLPRETRNYVPIILSIIITSKNQKRYGLNVKADPPLAYDTFELPSQTDLKVVSDLLGLPYETVQEMNPELRRGVSPPDHKYTIRLPKGMRRTFEIAYANLPQDQRVRRIVIPREVVAEGYRTTYGTRVVSYRARRGDTLAAVSRRHGVSVRELARLNRISERGTLRQGQTLRIPVKSRAGRLVRGKNSKLKGRRYSSQPAAKRSAKRSSGSKGKHAARRRRR